MCFRTLLPPQELLIALCPGYRYIFCDHHALFQIGHKSDTNALIPVGVVVNRVTYSTAVLA